MKRKKLFISLGVIVALLAIFFVLSRPEQAETVASDKNTNIYSFLALRGIEDAVVDVSQNRVLVRYNLPESINKTDAIILIVSGGAFIAPEMEKIIIQTYQNFEPVDEITVSMKDAVAFVGGKISEEEFFKKIS